MTDCVKRGEAALDQQKFEEAVKEFTTAIANFPRSVDYHLKRSAAYSRSSPPQFDAALKDVNQALRLAVERAKRELIGQAQLRRAILLFNMGQYADADYVLGLVRKLDEKNKTLPIWQSKIDSKLKTIPEGDEKRAVTVKEIPDEEEEQAKEVIDPAPVAESKTPSQTPPSQIKHEFYQSRESVTFTLLAKGVPKDKAQIEIEENSISISFPTLTGTDYHFSLDPLYAPIVSSMSTYKITPTRVELVLKKKTPGQSWKTLEGSGAPAADTTTTSDQTVKKAVLADKPPEYPTSSRKGPKNWDKVVQNITKKPKTADNDADADDDDLEDHGGDEANYFFKKLFKGANPETQRAMMKSYQESNGTVLSTNWDEVSKGKVETSPPDGMEVKKWEQ